MDVIEQYKLSREQLFDKMGIRPESKIALTDGPIKNVHYLETGEGEPLILMHGGGSSSDEWFNIIKPLSAHFHLYVVDRPGHGLSDPFNYRNVSVKDHAVEFIHSFMDSQGLAKAHFVAQSMGGYFSICFALQCPDRVGKLLVIGAPAGMNRRIPLLLRLIGTRGLNRILMTSIGRPSISNVKKLYQNLFVTDIEKLHDNYFKLIYNSQLLPGWRKSFSTLLENVLNYKGFKKEHYIGDKLNRLKIPVRFIWGDKDAFESPEDGFEKTKTMANCQFNIVENAGHCPWLDQPDVCVDLIIRSIHETDAGGGKRKDHCPTMSSGRTHSSNSSGVR